MRAMLLAFYIVTTLADTTSVGFDELNLAMNTDTSTMLQIPLLMDSFNKLDINGDGFLDKQERKPLKIGMYIAVGMLYGEGDHVPREVFIEQVSVPDFGGHEGTEGQCIQEDAVVEMDPEELWTLLAEDRAWLTVAELADALYEKAEPNVELDFATFQALALDRTHPQDFHAEDQFSMVKISDYTESHNTVCQENAVARRRRRMFVAETIAAVVAAVRWVAKAVAIAAVGALAECGVQAAMHNFFPHGPMNWLYNEGCTWNALATDFMFNLGAQAFTGVGMWAWGSVTSMLGWGGAAAATGGTVSGGMVGTELGVPLLTSVETQTEGSVLTSASTQTSYGSVTSVQTQTGNALNSIAGGFMSL